LVSLVKKNKQMKLKNSLIGFFLIISLVGSTSIPSDEGDGDKDKFIISVLTYVLTQGHFHPQEFDDAFSKRVFDEFIESLDSSKRYFMQPDLEEFSKYRYEIDDQVKILELDFFNLVYERFKQRTKDAKVYYEEILKEPFNFEKKETIDTDFEGKKFANNILELKENWRKYLKYNTLSVIYDKEQEEKDKQEEDASYQVKTFETLEEASRASTLERMNDMYDRMDEFKKNDWFTTFINTITNDFDPHTVYLDPSLKKRFDISMSGKLEGIGARLTKKNEYTKISEIISGGPAWKQGELESEDIILKVAQGNKEPLDITGMRLDKSIEYIKGKKGSEVRLTVKKVDGSVKVISIIRDVVEIEETFIKSSIVEVNDKKLGIINLPKFYINFQDKKSRNAASDMEKEIELLKKENIDGLLIDLRNNGGGSLKTVIDITGLFIKQGPVVQVKYRGKKAEVKSDKEIKVAWSGPLVVLVNEASASASEIFAAAMQDYERAIIIGGNQTYGKGTVQNVLDLNRYADFNSDLGALKMTIQKFYRINGGSTQLKGVASDINLPSKYSYMEIGERDYKNALEFDKVPELTYKKWKGYKNIKSVLAKSHERIEENETFNQIDAYAKWLKEASDDTTIFLNYKEFKEDLSKNEVITKKFKEISDYKSDLAFLSPSYELAMFEGDDDLREKRERWHEDLCTDVHLSESLNVLSDLKMKSSYWTH